MTSAQSPVEGENMMGIDRPVTYELRDGIAWLGLNRLANVMP